MYALEGGFDCEWQHFVVQIYALLPPIFLCSKANAAIFSRFFDVCFGGREGVIVSGKIFCLDKRTFSANAQKQTPPIFSAFWMYALEGVRVTLEGVRV